MKTINSKILLAALKSLPVFKEWCEEEWIFYYAFPDKTKDRRLVFRKNHEDHSWDLIT